MRPKSAEIAQISREFAAKSREISENPDNLGPKSGEIKRFAAKITQNQGYTPLKSRIKSNNFSTP